jgi:flagellar biogenesis protein FliO
METAKQSSFETEKKIWFSMWFLTAIVTFGLAFFPMFHRLIVNRNRHFKRESELENQLAAFAKKQGRDPPAINAYWPQMNANAWTVSIILVIPAFVVTYLLSKDLIVHEKQQDQFLASAISQRVFMPQTIPIKTYALITILTLGVGGVYWLYKVVNLYNAHFKAHMQFEKELNGMMEEK